MTFPLASNMSPGTTPAGQAPRYFWSVIIVVPVLPADIGLKDVTISEWLEPSPETVTVSLVVVTVSAFLHSVSLIRIPFSVISLSVLQLGPCFVAAFRDHGRYVEVRYGAERIAVHAQAVRHHQVITLNEHHADIPLGSKQSGKTLIHIEQSAPVVEHRPLAAYENLAGGWR
jgi:hypothetical protein